jgi:pimeloyl-ACP methyl ester carboxylesterase
LGVLNFDYQFLSCPNYFVNLYLLLSTISLIIFCRLMTRFMANQSTYTLDSLLSDLSCPLLLLWGDLDPWVGPAKANRIKEFYPKSTLVNLQAGHCPHDEVPELVNKALLDWLATLTPQVTLQTV